MDFFHIYEPWMSRIEKGAEKGQLRELARFIEVDGELKNMKRLK